MPSPQATIKLQMPHPGTDNVSKCPTVARWRGWALLELTDALYVRINVSTLLFLLGPVSTAF